MEREKIWRERNRDRGRIARRERGTKEEGGSLSARWFIIMHQASNFVNKLAIAKVGTIPKSFGISIPSIVHSKSFGAAAGHS